MLDFSLIKNEKLRNLMQASAEFGALPESQQKEHIAKIKDLPITKQEEVIRYFESRKEDAATTLKKLYQEFLDLEAKFKKLLALEPENKEREKDTDRMGNLIQNLNKII